MSVKFFTFLRKEPVWNTIVGLLLLFCFSLFVAGVALKANEEEDNTVDFLKLFLVWTNIVLLAILMFQKSVFPLALLWLKLIIIVFIIMCNAAALTNLAVLIYNIENPNRTDDYAFLEYNYDNLTLGINIAIDFMYLVFYLTYRSWRSIAVTSSLVVAQIIIFAVTVGSTTDFAVDIGNFVVSIVTAFVGIYLWSSDVSYNPENHKLIVKDFFIRDDLERAEASSFIEKDPV